MNFKSFFIKYKTAVIGTALSAAIVASAGAAFVMNADKVEQLKTETVHELGQEFSINVNDYFKAEEDTLKKAVVDTASVDVSKTGTYDVVVTFKNKEFTIKVTVEDTTAPVIEIENRAVITNTLETGMEPFGVYFDADAASTVTLDRFVKLQDVEVLEGDALKKIADDTMAVSDKNTFADRDAFIPEEDGVYSAVLKVADSTGNTAEEEVIVVYDTTAPEFKLDSGDAAEIELEKKDISENPGNCIDKLTISDNVDGVIEPLDENISMEDKGEDDGVHTWEVSVKAADTAGNEGTFTYKILVSKKAEPVAQTTPSTPAPSTPAGTTTPDSGSAGGGSGQDVIVVNGMTLDVSEGGAEHAKMMANAGYYNPVYSNGQYFMLIKRTDNDMEWVLWLHNYITERGGTPGDGGGNNFCDLEGQAYQIYVYVQ